MYQGKKVLAMIPARGGNDGLKNMNMRELGGKPLIYYTIKAAQSCDFIDRLIVSTEDPVIADYCRSLGVEVPFQRSVRLVSNNVVMEPIIDEALNFFKAKDDKFDILINLYPNAPFKDKELIRRFVDKVQDYDLVIPLFGHRNYFWEETAAGLKLMIDKTRTTRQQTIKKYEELGGIYAYNLSSERWRGGPEAKVGFCELDFHDSRMVNSIYDLIILDRLVRLPKSLISDLLKNE
jgi:CMP-N-acetylneuraminic acid synthetase